MRGRKPKPEYLQLLSGHAGKRPPKDEPRPQPDKKCPSPPVGLCRSAKSEWRRLAPELHKAGLLTARYRAVMAIYCEAWARFESATRQQQDKEGDLSGLVVKTGGSVTTITRKNGEVMTVRKNPSYTTHPALWVQNQAAQVLLRCAGELGLSPAALARVASPSRKPSGEDDEDGWADLAAPEES